MSTDKNMIRFSVGDFRKNLAETSGISPDRFSLMMKDINKTFVENVDRTKYFELRKKYDNMSIDDYMAENPNGDYRFGCTISGLGQNKTAIVSFYSQLGDLDDKYSDGTTLRDNLEIIVHYTDSVNILSHSLGFIDEHKAEIVVDESHIEKFKNNDLTDDEKKELDFGMLCQNVPESAIYKAIEDSCSSTFESEKEL